MHRRWVVILFAAIAVALIAPILLLAVGGLGGPRSIVATPSAAPRHQPSGASQPGLASPDSVAIDDAAWWRLAFDPMNGVPSVDIGTLDRGITVRVELRQRIPGVGDVAIPNRRVVGPSDGMVVLVEEDGPESVLSAVDAANGDRREIHRTDDFIIDAAFATGSRLVFLTADPIDGAPTAAWHLDIMAGGAPMPIDGQIAAHEDVRLVARAAWITNWLVSAEGDAVGVLRCEIEDCVLRVVSLDEQEDWIHRLEFGESPIAMSGGIVVLRPACVDVDCRIELLDLESGVRQQVPGDGSQFIRMAVVDGLLVTALPGEGTNVQVIELEGLERRRALSIPLGSMEIISQPDYEFGVETPPGWFVARGSVPRGVNDGPPQVMELYAINASDGAVVPLPAIGDWFIQG